MSWSIYYAISCERDWSDADTRWLREHQAVWNDRLSALCEGYDVSGIVTSARFRGAMKPSPSAQAASDYVAIVLALRELQQRFPEADVRVSDDSQINDETPVAEIDLEAVRAAVLDEWGPHLEDLEDLEHEDELEEVLAPDRPAQPSELDAAFARVKPLLDQAARDFEIWKNAQREKKSK